MLRVKVAIMVASNKRTIFRNKALHYYVQSREKDVLPRFVAPPVFIFLWVLLGLLLVATLLAWLGRVPTYVTGSGVILNSQGSAQQAGNGEATAIIFLPATSSSSLKVRAGMAILLQVGTAGPALHGKIATVEPEVMSPSEARTKYSLNGSLALAITQPSIAVSVKLGPGLPAQKYTGSIVGAQVQVGSRSVLSLLPIIGQLIGE